jgi:hypothetical protein
MKKKPYLGQQRKIRVAVPPQSAVVSRGLPQIAT